ncbi:ATP-binding protein [Paenibacillus chitinolyticus]|uniref:histidine kinase n=1 Tax=Paenibacillus chitinolyticus TaxID=79263 RepID=A0ABT4FDZ9_9BACL|nr:ATP-binding protein [Paenibacillus chitinolyticus]MCY9591142.1 ATP-binding protein [Paenibacillus chitinolyticus]MCY9596717.1 ATP-binding protein [Paenibacillus chitinolyticus]
MKKQALFFILGAALILLLPVYLVLQHVVSIERNPDAVDGTLDLRAWNFADKGTVRLSGEWEFYRGKLLVPGDFHPSAETGKTPPMPTGMAQIPGKWNAYMGEEGDPAAEGYATFRLNVRLNETDGAIYGIRTGNIRMANRVFVNGLEVGASGTPGRTAAEENSDNVPYTGYTYLKGSEAEIVVQVSNHSYSSGGIFTPILFGDEKSVMKSREAALFSEWMTMAGFLIPGLYFLVLYRMRRNDPASLYLGLFCLVGLLFVLTHGEKMLAAAWPGFSYTWLLKVQLMVSSFVYFFLLRYVAVAVPGGVHPLALRVSSFVTAAGLLAGLLLPPVVFSRLEVLILAISFLSMCYMAFVLLRDVRKRSEDTLLMIAGVMSILMVIAAYVLNLVGLYEGLLLVPAEMLMFVLTQAILLAQRFNRTFVEVDQLSQRLLSLDGLKDEFMANTSHELRTPLHGMVNMAQSMLEGASGALNVKQRNDLAMIVSTGRRLTLLINDILDFSKLKNGEIVLKRQPVDLKAATNAVLEVMTHVARHKDIRFEQEWPDRLPWLLTDEDRLQQILYNLIGNAVKFTPAGTVTIGAVTKNGHVLVFVKDTGIGIAENRMEEIFHAYDQGVDPGDRDYEGTGLGLSITKKLVELGEGKIEAESRLGEGSVFRFTVPSTTAAPEAARTTGGGFRASVARDETAAAVLPEGLEDRRAGKIDATVLLVDDDPVNLQVLYNLLSVEGYRLIAVDGGAKAMAHIGSGLSIDLVIADWMMPGMSGLELCRAIRDRISLAELPVLLLTARSLPEDVRTGFQAGANDFLRKPVDADELRARVRTLLEMRKSVRNAVSAEMAFLQAQIKPHFLYNALNTIIALLPSDPDKTTKLLLELSRYLRGSFDFQNRDQLVPLQKEMALVQSYLVLEKARFEERLQVIYDIRAEPNRLIPPLSIQPIVENAVRHGIMRRAEGGTIGISVEEKEDVLLVEITDNGVGMEPGRAASLLSAEAGGGVGLINIHTRLLTMFGEGLDIRTEAGQGTTVQFRVPNNGGTRGKREEVKSSEGHSD